MKEIRHLSARIGRPVKLMEVCGTHTMTAFRCGLRSLLPPEVALFSGPGCPVCVTPTDYVDRAIAVAQEPGVIVATFGDMVRIPGTNSSLEEARARGAQIRIVYSPLDALQLARANPQQRVVFLGIGFETTAPTTAWAILEARKNTPNFAVLCAHKTMPYAMAALLQGDAVPIDGFLCPGHVSVIIGSGAFEFIARQHGIPCVVAGFEPGDMVQGIAMLLRQIADRRAAVEIQYSRSVTREGNVRAQVAIREVFEECDVSWRGLGVIPHSGLRIQKALAAQDAEQGFPNLAVPKSVEPHGCRCGDVLRGVATPPDCPLFRRRCTPDDPVGACMVSSEGTCAAYFKYA